MRLQEVPVPKFRIGQGVFVAVTKDAVEELPCPDCLGTTKWTVRSPAGAEATVDCPRCRGAGKLGLQSVSYQVRTMTIGSIRITTTPYGDDDPVEYMCDETGIGSGTIWKESRVHLELSTAEAQGAILAAEARQRLEDGWQKKERAQMRELSTYQLKDAEIKAAESEAWDARWETKALRERICELLGDWPYLMPDKELTEDENRESDSPASGSLTLDLKQRTLLVEHLMSGYRSDGHKKFLIEWRAEKAKKCDC